jgi:hypothetical protein
LGAEHGLQSGGLSNRPRPATERIELCPYSSADRDDERGQLEKKILCRLEIKQRGIETNKGMQKYLGIGLSG